MTDDMIPRSEANAMVAAAYQAAADLIGRPDIDLEDVLGTQKAIIALTPDDAREAEADVIRAAVAEALKEAGRCPQCEARENAFLESIRIKQQCRHCGYQSIDWLGENAACPMRDCNGGMLTVPRRAAEVRESKS